MYRGGRVLAFLHDREDLVVLNVGTGDTEYKVAGAGGPGCQEVLYDVSTFSALEHLPNRHLSCFSSNFHILPPSIQFQVCSTQLASYSDTVQISCPFFLE